MGLLAISVVAFRAVRPSAGRSRPYQASHSRWGSTRHAARSAAHRSAPQSRRYRRDWSRRGLDASKVGRDTCRAPLEKVRQQNSSSRSLPGDIPAATAIRSNLGGAWFENGVGTYLFQLRGACLPGVPTLPVRTFRKKSARDTCQPPGVRRRRPPGVRREGRAGRPISGRSRRSSAAGCRTPFGANSGVNTRVRLLK